MDKYWGCLEHPLLSCNESGLIFRKVSSTNKKRAFTGVLATVL